ncbi:helix-turn-helix transcriptional regulator [Desulfovibrio sp. OttesenSCG-928-I05]|nr:helix-turn-helix transcriptional regulator [Desulfovibrio sp. OttesenSCG-928-I05]
MKQDRLISQECPVEIAMLRIRNKWKIFITYELQSGTRRFNELRRSIPTISQKVLTQNLRSMEEDGLVTRQVFAEVPPRVEYTLSELGSTLTPVIDALADWRTRYQEFAAGKNSPDKTSAASVL